jgi:hypothetical protein
LLRKPITSSVATMTATTVPISVAWTNAGSPLSAKSSMKPTIIAAMTKRTSQSGVLGSGSRLDGPQRAEQRDAPRIHRVGLGPVLHPRPLLMDDRAAVADELCREAAPRGRRKEVRHLVLLREGERLGLGAGARVVVAGERQNHHETEQDGEAGGQDAEDAGCTIAVMEVAAIRGMPADEKQGRDRERRRRDDDEKRDEDVHAGAQCRIATGG